MRLTILFAAVLTLPIPAAASDWQDIKDPAELRALYSNKTLRGKDWMDRPFIGHYRADGNGVLLTQGDRYPRTWAPKGNDQICVTTPVSKTCYRFQRHASKAGVYRLIDVANGQALEVTIEDGIPKF